MKGLIFMKKHWTAALSMITAVVALICCILCHRWDSNLVSMISGLWSALATVVLGGIAFWQNKRYKELSDELNDRQDAPEFFVSSPATSGEKWQSDLVFSATGTKSGGIQTDTNCILWFSSIDKPLLHLSPVSINIEGEIDNLSLQGRSEINVYKPYQVFGLELRDVNFDFEGKQEAKIYFEYENIYGIRYSKTYTYPVTINNGKVRSRSWGKLTRAERMK